MALSLDDATLADIETRAAEMAQGTGEILSRHFGTSLDVEYKDEKKTDPVTNADLECQEFVERAVSNHFPDHGLVGEEGPEEGQGISPDFVWVVDPLDGTQNFLNGLPVYASSIGVLYRGRPIAGAVFVPWPGEGGGAVLHARRGGGAFLQDEPLAIFQGDEPEPQRLTTIPGPFGKGSRMVGALRGKVGELRVTGSIVYELAMVARGVLQCSVTTNPRLWDAVAGVVLVVEAGGSALVGRRTAGIRLPGTKAIRWAPLESFVDDWESGKTTLKELRQWSAPMVLGSPGIARYFAGRLGRRSSLGVHFARALGMRRRR